MKKALVIIGICLLVGYLIFAAFYFEGKPKDGVCSEMQIFIENNGNEKFLDAGDIESYLTKKGCNPKGKHFEDINTDSIESVICNNKMIKKSEVYVTGNGIIKVNVLERKPILRVISDSGENYYIDDEGKRMPVSSRHTPYLPIATGNIKEEFACNDLYTLAQFLQKDKFWNAQIEQIVVAPNEDITFISRVGNHEIILGKIEGYQKKLDKLLTFYQNGLNETGWNKYSVINLKYDKQVVCKKR